MKDKQRDQTRSRLLAAAKRLFGEFGYGAVSVTDIAREAGVSHSMINAHFNAKAGLLYEIIRESNSDQTHIAEELSGQDGTMMQRIGRIIGSYARHDLRDPELLSVMQSYFWTWPASTEEDNRISLGAALAPLGKILEDAKNYGELSEDFGVERAIWAIFAIYTMELRTVLYDGATIEDCVVEIMAKVDMLLAGARVSAA